MNKHSGYLESILKNDVEYEYHIPSISVTQNWEEGEMNLNPTTVLDPPSHPEKLSPR